MLWKKCQGGDNKRSVWTIVYKKATYYYIQFYFENKGVIFGLLFVSVAEVTYGRSHKPAGWVGIHKHDLHAIHRNKSLVCILKWGKNDSLSLFQEKEKDFFMHIVFERDKKGKIVKLKSLQFSILLQTLSIILSQ